MRLFTVPSHSLERQQHNYCPDDEQTECAECAAAEQRKGQANSACASPRKPETVTVRPWWRIVPSTRLLCVWVSPSLQLTKCSGAHQQWEAVTVGGSWVLVVL